MTVIMTSKRRRCDVMMAFLLLRMPAGIGPVLPIALNVRNMIATDALVLTVHHVK